MTNLIFWDALKEASYMGILVFVFSNLWGNRIGASFAAKHSNPEKWNMFAAAPFTHWLFGKIFREA